MEIILHRPVLQLRISYPFTYFPGQNILLPSPHKWRDIKPKQYIILQLHLWYIMQILVATEHKSSRRCFKCHSITKQ